VRIIWPDDLAQILWCLRACIDIREHLELAPEWFVERREFQKAKGLSSADCCTELIVGYEDFALAHHENGLSQRLAWSGAQEC
jgi:hypothetical protein